MPAAGTRPSSANSRNPNTIGGAATGAAGAAAAAATAACSMFPSTTSRSLSGEHFSFTHSWEYGCELCFKVTLLLLALCRNSLCSSHTHKCRHICMHAESRQPGLAGSSELPTSARGRFSLVNVQCLLTSSFLVLISQAQSHSLFSFPSSAHLFLHLLLTSLCIPTACPNSNKVTARH